MSKELQEVIELIECMRDADGVIFIQTEKVKSKVCAVLKCDAQTADRLIAMSIKVRKYGTDIIAMVPYIYDGI